MTNNLDPRRVLSEAAFVGDWTKSYIHNDLMNDRYSFVEFGASYFVRWHSHNPQSFQDRAKNDG